MDFEHEIWEEPLKATALQLEYTVCYSAEVYKHVDWPGQF